ncbi:hypothetical protein ABTZ46_16110 [Nocardioides sp. NPDC126508]
MPKAAAPSPTEWATGRYGFHGFDLDELNHVVRDYAFIELHESARRKRWPLPVRAGVKVLPWIVAILLGGPLLMAIVLAGGGSQDYSETYLIGLTCAGSAAGGSALLYFFLPWMLQPHRQWPRTPHAISIMLTVPLLATLVMIYRVDAQIYPRWPMVVPVWLCLTLTIGAIVCCYRYYDKSKPPVVDLATLSEDEIEVLTKCRHRALKVLRSRGVVAYKDFDAYDAAPLWEGRGG